MDTLAGKSKVIVKTPLSSDNGKEDFTVEVSPDWTVRQLKERISEVLPKKTIPDDQKIIFSGSVLADHVLLRDCFRLVAPGSSPVVHLVCKLTTTSAKIPEPVASASSSQPEGLHRRHVQPVASSSFSPYFASPISTPTFDQANMAQYYQNYQAYLNQYMYSQLSMNPMAMQPHLNTPHFHHHHGTPGPVMDQNLQLRMNQAQFQLPNNNNNAAPVAPMNGAAAPGANVPDPQVVMNAQGGMADGGEGDQRDAFDRVYMAIRLVALLFAIYFSSSTSRFFVAFSLLSVFLLFNTIRDFRRWRDRQRRNDAPAEQPPAAAVPQHGENAAAVVPPVEAAPEQDTGLLMTVLNLVVGFFTTLVPDLQGVVA